MTTNAFAALGLRPELTDVLTTLGYEAPTPIQEKTIPILVEGRDVIGEAQTGTGKTAAFALPILQRLDPREQKTQALVLTPTRELAVQVADAIHVYAQKIPGVSVLPVYGGAPIVHQLKRLQRGAQIVVGTPGRLIDHLDRTSLQLGDLKMIVLDEADEMLKMGFIEDIERILSSAPTPRQTALFSATMPQEVLRIAQRYLTDPERVQIEHRQVSAPSIEQRFLNVSEGQKLEILTRILELEQGDAVLIFRRTKTGAAELAEKLEGRGFAAVAMHGDMNQPARESVIRRLRSGQVEVVVATDVAARGLDVEQIAHVINYDVPNDVEAYVHRIGRTGRAGRSGIATLFITPRERRMMREIERYTGAQIKPMKMPSGADIAAHRVSIFKDSIRKTVQEGDLDLYVTLVEQLIDEGQHDATEIAAAAAKLATGARRLVAEPEIPMAPAFNSSPAPRSADAPAVRGGADEDRTVRMQMSVGKRDGIRPADVVGSVANEADIPGREIGPIEILDDVTYFGIPERYVERVLEKVGRSRFRGQAVNLQRATGEPPARSQRSSGDRPAPRYDKPRYDKPRFGKSEERDERPRRSFRDDAAPRSGGDAPREFRPKFRDRFAPSGPPRDNRGPDDRPRRTFSGPPRDRDAAPRREFRSEGPARRPAGGGFRDRDAGPSRSGFRPSSPGPRPFGAGRRRDDEGPRRPSGPPKGKGKKRF